MNSVLCFVKRFLKILGQGVYRFLSMFKIVKPSVIVLVDGGICSQMYQYLMGYYLKSVRNIPVEYNTIWFDVDGRDAQGNSVRNFDLLKVFPTLDFPIASLNKCKWYNRLFPYYAYSFKDYHKKWWTVNPPTSLLGYFSSPAEVYKPFNDVFKADVSKVLDPSNLNLYNRIPEYGSVAVHVRRGDLSTYRPLYGNPVSEDYFVRAIQYFLDRTKKSKFYFFSDDTNYVREILIPSIPQMVDYEIVQNGDDRGYMDLILISRCQHQITSKGSLGKFGAMMGNQDGKIVIIEKSDENIGILKGMGCDYIML